MGSSEKWKKLVSPTREDVCYIAGFLDGEGSIYVHRNKGNATRQPGVQPRVAIYQTDRSVLEFIAARFGGSLTRANTAAMLQICGQADVQAILEQTLPYLRVKSRQATLALILLAYKQKYRDDKLPRNQFSPYKTREYEIAEEIRAMQAYKAKPAWNLAMARTQ